MMGADLNETAPAIERAEGLVPNEFVPLLNARMATSSAASSLLIATHRALAGMDFTFEKGEALDRLRAAADALGYDMVKRT
jgi:hypothetical protein